MLRLLIFRFWPVLIPLIAYGLWFYCVGRKATIDGKPVMRFADGPWYRIVLASLLLAMGCFFIWGATEESVKGTYIPAHLDNGVMVPGHVEKTP